MGRRKQFMDEDVDSSDDEGGRINFDVTDQDREDEAMGFSGFQRARNQKRQKRFADDMGYSEDEDDDGSSARMGLGSSSRSSTMADTTTSFLPAKKDPTKERVKAQDTSSSINSSNRKRSSSPLSGQRGSSAPSSPGPGFADFTKHTTGIGMKLLQQMGWTAGKGLGAGGEGMVNPVETKQRPKNMGIGFRGFQERTDQARLDAMEESSESEEDDQDKATAAAPRQAWKRKEKAPATAQQLPSGKQQRKPKKVTYQTATDILAETQQQQQQQQKVIDMTGPSVREIDIADIKRTDSPTLMETTTRLPELRHNMRLIVDLSRGDLENLSREKQATTLRLSGMKEELEAIEQKHKVDQERLEKIQQAKAIGLQLQQTARDALANGMYENANITTLFGESFDQLKTNYMDQVVQLGLDAMVVAVWAPIMKYKCVHWDVLTDPTWGVDDIKRWQPLLRSNDDNMKKKSSNNTRRHLNQNKTIVATPYETMMNTIWLSKVRSAINNTWNVREPDAVIQLMEAWKDTLPRFIYENIIYQLILPKVARAVNDWDPRNDEQLVHTWIHPWLPVLQAWRMADIFTTIRHKLSVILRQWHPSDESALEVIGRWKDVWTAQQMDTFLQKNVLPKLTQVLRQEFVVNPRDQQLEPLAWCLAWQGILSDTVFGVMLEKEVFPQWLRVLYKWLTIDPDKVNFDEVKEWYMWWKQVFASFGVGDHPVLLKCTRKALDMMSAASSGEPIEPPVV